MKTETRITHIPVWVQCGLLLGAVLVLPAHADTLKPFTSDGCSSFPDGTLAQQQLWLDCCVAHDYAYWKGGTELERMQADAALHSCVAKVGQPAVANVMLAGVRAGGGPYWPTKYRWGYGWSWPRFYGPLTQEELQQVEAANKILPSAL
jgi:hypothetical protein